MSINIVDRTALDNALTATADAIRAKTGGTADLTFDMENETGFEDAIENSGLVKPTGTKNITTNGTHDVSEYANASVNVPIPEPKTTQITVQSVDIERIETPPSGFDAISSVRVVPPAVYENPKIITTNGTYNAGTNSYYKEVVVNVPQSGTLVEKNISANGTYNASSDNADGYSKVVVNVPSSELPILPNPSTWGSTTFTLDQDYQVKTLQFYQGETLIIPSGTKLVLSGTISPSIMILKGEIIVDGGTVEIQTSAGMVISSIPALSGEGILTVNYGNIKNYGTIVVNDGGTIILTEDGNLSSYLNFNIESGATVSLLNSCSINNFGKLSNAGVLELTGNEYDSGGIRNQGTLINTGTIRTEVLTNSAVLVNHGTIELRHVLTPYPSFYNADTVLNYSTMTFDTDFPVDNDGDFANIYGTISGIDPSLYDDYITPPPVVYDGTVI